jgi:hypothetical protein
MCSGGGGRVPGVRRGGRVPGWNLHVVREAPASDEHPGQQRGRDARAYRGRDPTYGQSVDRRQA